MLHLQRSPILSRILLSFVVYASAGPAFAAAKKSPAPNASIADRVWVKKHDGGVACEDPTGAESVEGGQKMLEKAGIEVYESRKQTDGKMRAQVCGIPTGKENAYLIPRADLAKAQKQGFSPEIPEASGGLQSH